MTKRTDTLILGAYYATVKIAIQLSDEEDERNFYLDYKEIIDEMIEERNLGKLQRFY